MTKLKQSSANPRTTGEAVRALREAREWSQAQLAKRAGVSRSLVAMLESNPTRHTRAAELDKLARALATTSTALLRGEALPRDVAQSPAGRYAVASVEGGSHEKRMPFVSWAHIRTMGLSPDRGGPLEYRPYLADSPTISEMAMATRAPDNTLYPHLSAGDEIVLDPQQPPLDGMIVLARADGGAPVLRLYEELAHGLFRLVANAAEARPWRSDERTLEVLATVVRITHVPAQLRGGL
jgi:transcriptional regulator with XRE-family HTH domain